MRGRKQRMGGGSLYWPIGNRTLRSTIVLNVSFKKKKSCLLKLTPNGAI